MSPAPEVGIYPTAKGDEHFLRFHSISSIQIIIIESFFEERNFLRRTVANLARTLAEKGIGSFIPDLPGCGDSLTNISEVRMDDWRDALAAAASWVTEKSGHPIHIASIRGGALLDDVADAASTWRFAPATGIDLLRPLKRASNLSATHDLAGYSLHPELVTQLEQATPARMAGPGRECRAEQEGAPLWRRAEPAEDQALVRMLADDLEQWVRQCVPA